MKRGVFGVALLLVSFVIISSLSVSAVAFFSTEKESNFLLEFFGEADSIDDSCDGADYVFEWTDPNWMIVVGDDCFTHPTITTIDSKDVNITSAGKYMAIVRSLRGQPSKCQHQPDESYFIEINGVNSSISYDTVTDSDGCSDYEVRNENLGIFSFNAGLNTIFMHTIAKCPPSHSANSVEVDRLCLFRVEECGDGILDDGEECDDGNNIDGDGCDSDCTSESLCYDLNLPSSPVGAILDNIAFPSDILFNTTLYNVPSGYDVHNQTYKGWCFDLGTPEGSGIDFKLYSSYNPPAHLANENWSYANYILNHKKGTNWLTINDAIWHFVNLGPSIISPTNPQTQAMIDDALANGEGFKPNSSQVIAVLLDPVNNSRIVGGHTYQYTLIEVPCRFCGDGILDPEEKCDDGNNIDGDGCDSDCKFEEDIFNFCGQFSCGYDCFYADYLDNEEEKYPHDCIIAIIEKEGKLYPKCVPTTCAD